MPADQFDLNGQLRGHVTVTPEEHSDDRKLRLKNEERSAWIEDCKGVAVFATLLILLVGIVGLSSYEGFFDAAASPDTRRWAQTVLSSVVTGAISFVVGRKIGGK